MLDPTTIILGIIFLLIIAIFIVVTFYSNRSISPTALITTFGITIQGGATGLFMTIENANTQVNPTDAAIIVPIMSLKPVFTGLTPEPTEGWVLARPSNNPMGDVITFENTANSAYINYQVTPDGKSITTPYVKMDKVKKPSDPVDGHPETQIGWFVQNTVVVNQKTYTMFLCMNPPNQYLIFTSEGILKNNPDIQPVTIGPAVNGNNLWLVGQ